MNASLQNLISVLKDVPEIRSSKELHTSLQKIEEYSEYDEQAAYLLGQFFKNKFSQENLPPPILKELKQTIKKQHLQSYYYLKTAPEKEYMDILSLSLILAGIAAIIIGIIHLSNGVVIIKLNLRYLNKIFDNGGYKIILGIVLIASGISRFEYEKQKHNLLKDLKLE